MKNIKLFSTLLLVAALSVGVNEVSAKSTKKVTSTPSKVTQTPSKSAPMVVKSKPTVVKSSKPKVVTSLPRQSSVLKHKGVDYYRHNGKYYKKSGTKFIIAPPPFGLRVAAIPLIHLAFMYNNARYYSAEGVIYQQTSDDSYVVVEPEIGMVIPELPTVNVDQVSIDGTIYFQFENMLYKQIPTASGLQYEVVGTLAL